MATLAAVTSLPALGLVGEDGRLERSTEPFRRWYEANEELCLESPELKRVLDGQASAAVLKLDGAVIAIAAMADRDGGRHVLLTLPTSELPSLGDAADSLLDGALDESPALVWLKDLDGRYVRANARFTTFLSTSEERLLGRTDAELPPTETVDGPRNQDRDADVEEPVHLEYFVGPYQGREALAVLRFPVGDRQGVPTLVCGVAAPSSEAQVARSEAARLLRVERWSRLDADSVRAELLADWGLLPDARGRSVPSAPAAGSGSGIGSAEAEAAVAEARAERATAVAERDTALGANEQLTAELGAAQARLAELERALKSARAAEERGDAEAKLAEQAAELDRALARESERAEELERTLSLVRQRLGDDAEAARAEVQRARADADAARTEVQRARADAETARTDLEKARTDAEAARAAVATERESATEARAQLEREVRQTRDQLAALERQQGTDDSGAQLRAAEKARLAAEAALADAIAERDAALKSRAVLTGELEHERTQVAALRESSAATEERILELAGAAERERVRAGGLDQAQARLKELEGELRTATMRADKAEVELEVTAARAAKLEGEVRAALERQQGTDESGARLNAVEKARIAAEAALADAVAERDGALKARAALAGELETERKQVVALRESAAASEERILELAGGMERERVRAAGLDEAQARAKELEGELRSAVMRADKAEVELEVAAARADKVDADVEQWRSRATQLESDLERGRSRTDEMEAKLEDSRTRITELEGELKTAQGRVAELEDEVKVAHARIQGLEEELDEARTQAEEAVAAEASVEIAGAEDEAAAASVASAEPATPAGRSVPSTTPAAELATLETPDAGARHAAGVSWQPAAKRTLSASLARESVWRNVLKETVEVLGSEGGWDTVTAWLPDEANQLACAATWTAHRGLDRFEALTGEVTLKRDGSLLDQALQAPHLTWLTDLDSIDDERLQTAAAHGMNSALLLPVRTGNTTIGLLELLTHDTIEPDAQIALSLEASALQLGRFGHLLSLGK